MDVAPIAAAAFAVAVAPTAPVLPALAPATPVALPVALTVPVAGPSFSDAMLQYEKRIYLLFTCLLVLLS